MSHVFSRRVSLWFALAAVLVVALAAAWYNSLRRANADARWVEHTYEVLYRVRALDAQMGELAAAVRGFGLTGDERFAADCRAAAAGAATDLAALRALTADNPSQQQRLREFVPVLARRLAQAEEAIAARKAGGPEAFLRAFLARDRSAPAEEVRRALAALDAEEQRLLLLRQAWADQARRWTFAVFVAGTLAGLAALGLASRGTASEAARLAEADRVLRESRERFEGIFVAATAGMAVSTPDGRWLDVNPALCAMVGYAREELVGNECSDITHPDDLGPDHDEARRLLAGETRSFRREKRFLHKDGHPVWVILSVALVRAADGRPLHFVSLMEDVTARRRAEGGARRNELRYASLVQATTAIVWNTLASGNFETEQPSWSEFTGQSTAELMGTGWLAAIHPDDQAVTYATWTAAYHARTLYEIEHRLRHRSGQYRHMVARAVPIFDDEGHMVEWVGTHTDVDHQRRAAAAMRVAKEAAEANDRAKGEFLANVSHEIRTPMNAILGMTELTLQTDLAPTQRDNLEVVRSATDALLSVINDLLDFSKIEAGKLDLDPVEFDLGDRLKDVLTLLGLRADAKGLELACRVAPGVPERYVGDASRLRQIIANLVGNAVKFTDRGEVVLEVALDGPPRAEPPEGEVVLHFRVTDTGIGIAPDKLETIFAPFTQADGTTTRLYGGTGLGLAISAHLAALMGGKVWVESTQGVGSTFHFTVKLTAAPPSPAALAAAAAGAAALRGMRVMVVDDNAVNRRILDEVLRRWGMVPTLADGGPAALQRLAEARADDAPFAVVLIDALMPGMDGVTLAERMKAEPLLAGAVVLMLTSADRQELAERCRRAGITACLNKPIAQAELKAAMLTAVAGGAAAAVPPAAPARPPGGLVARPLRVLLAEDNEFNQKVARLVLAKHGHAVTIANNGREAVEAVARQPFDLILMDVQMPVMDGFEAVAAIRASEAEAGDGRRLPIIALTAHAMKEDHDRCLAAGMDGYVSKPIRESALRQVIENCPALQPPAARDDPAPPAVPAEAPGSPLDVAAALALADDDRPFFDEMVALFLRDAPRMLDAARVAVAAGDVAALRIPAHNLKNWAGNFRAPDAYRALEALEALARAGLPNGSNAALATAEHEVNRLGDALAALDAAHPA